jgi:hypothetical protein
MSGRDIEGHLARTKITVRRVADNELRVTFPENITEDLNVVAGPEGEIPPEFLNAAIARSLASKKKREGGCTERCNKDCFW